MVDNLDGEDYYYDGYDQDIEFKVYIKEVEIFLKDFQMKPNFYYKKISNYSDFKKILSITKVKPVSPIEVFYKVKYDSYHKISQDDEKCSICLDVIYEFDKNCEFTKIKELHKSLGEKYNVCLFEKCQDHFFHVDCINNMIGTNNFIKCPICSKIYGKLTGNQPPGTMTASVMKGTFCSGYSCDTICVNYNFPGGSGFSGTSRTAYLPNDKDGMKILGLFKEAFDRKLLFTVGTSVTTGASNTTVWAGIHHKTSLSGGSSSFGYPDPTYFSRVQEELACKGVTEDSMDVAPEVVASRFLGGGSYSDNSSKISIPVKVNNTKKPAVNISKPGKKKK